MKIPVARRKIVLFLALVVALSLFNAGAVLAAGDGGHGEGHGTKGWVATDTQRVLNFTVLFVALFFLLRKPVANALAARIQGIKDQLADLDSQKAAAEKELAKYNEKLALLDKEAESIVAEYVRQGEEAKARILAEAKAAAGKLEEQAKRHIEHEFAHAQAKLQAEVIEKALAAAEEKLKAGITAEDQERLVDEYLEKVVA